MTPMEVSEIILILQGILCAQLEYNGLAHMCSLFAACLMMVDVISHFIN